MNYKLVKQLKDAGFPQHMENEGDVLIKGEGCGRITIINGRRYEQGCYIPTLSELIDACGEEISYLTKVKDQFGEWLWSAVTFSKKFKSGKTPKIAVAKLWLKLNEK